MLVIKKVIIICRIALDISCELMSRDFHLKLFIMNIIYSRKITFMKHVKNAVNIFIQKRNERESLPYLFILRGACCQVKNERGIIFYTNF